MAFWGIEVKTGKPYTHSFDRVRGRLHISQATLSIGTSAKKSLVQCNVGDKSPILLCALLPDKTESLQLDLEFEETDDVIFSVIGPRGVHLTGYYVGGCRNSSFQDDTESYGEDINSDTEESNRCADDEDEYDDSFINDGEPETLTPSPASSDGVQEEVYKKKKKDRKGGLKRLKKRYQMVESDDETCPQQNIVNGAIIVVESDDEDKLPISSICKSRTPSMNMMPESAEEKSNEVTILSYVETSNNMKEDDGSSPKTKVDSFVDSKEKVDAHFTSDERKMKEVPNCTSLMPAVVEDIPESQMNAKNKTKETEKIDDTFKEGKPQLEEEISQKSGGQNLLVEDIRDLEVATADNTFLSSPVEAGPENGKKSKKKKKYSKKEGQVHEINSGDPLKDAKGQQAGAELVTTDQDVLLRNNDDDDDDDRKIEVDQLCESILPSMDVGPERNSKGKKKRKERTEVKTDFSGSYLPVRTEQDGKLTSDNCDIVSDQLGDKYQSDDKKLKKKRRKKNKTEENVNMEVKEGKNTSVMETENNVDAKSSKVRTLSNGLIIEDLGTGNPKGKKAAHGKKVKVQYVVKLKDIGLVIDSNIGKSPYKFRLGDKDVIDGLNVGLEGMRVGDKRRLIIPPTMSCGSEGTGEDVPPNSWLVYDVDLVGVH